MHEPVPLERPMTKDDTAVDTDARMMKPGV
jgi:hypothetical protein